MARRLFLTIIAVAFVAALVAPVAASAGAARPVSVSPAVSGCTVFPAAWGKRIYDETVALVRADAYGSPSADLANHITYLYQRGCGALLDLYVDVRVSDAQFDWYEAVLVTLGFD